MFCYQDIVRIYQDIDIMIIMGQFTTTPEELCKEIQQVEQVTKATVLNPHPTSRDGKPYTSYTIHVDFSQEIDFPTIIPLWSVLTVVKQFILKPLRCFKCQKFGHNSLNCWGKDTCSICGDNHPMIACPEINKNRNERKVRCANCNGQHTVLSKECQDYKFRAAILKMSVTKCISFKDAVKAFTDTKGKTLHTPPPTLNFESFQVLVHPSIPPEAKIQEPINKEVVLLREKIDQLTTQKLEVQKILSSLKKSESFVSGNETDSEDGMDEDNFVPKKILSSPGKKTINKRVRKQKNPTMTTRVIQLNIRGMGKSKVVELKNLLVRSKPDIVLIQETLLNEQKTSPNFKGYSMARWDRKTGPGGGLKTLVKDNIPFKIVDDFIPGKNEIGIISFKEDGTDNWISVINYYNRTATDFDFKQFKDAFQKFNEVFELEFRKESWPEWQREVDSDLTDVELLTSVEELNEKLTQVMVNASERVFEYVKLKRKSRNSTPGWNAACQKAYKERNTARNEFRRNPTVTNKIEMNAKQAIFRKIVPQEIKNGWKTLIETKFTKTTSIKELWRNWKVYTGQRSSPISGIMMHNGTTVHQGRLCPIALEKSCNNTNPETPKVPYIPKVISPNCLDFMPLQANGETDKKIVLPEIEKVVQPEQLGFLPQRSTIDCLVRRENQIKQGFRLGKETLAVFLDMTSAFDREKSNKCSTPIVSLAGVDIQHAEKFCYLGVLLDSKLLWTNNIDYLVGNLRSRAKFLNAICLSKRGAPYSCVSKLIGATITSKLDYGSMFYREATKHNLQKLDSAFNQVLRRALGCLKTTPIPALYCELGVTSLQRRRNNLQARYFLKKMGSTNHIVYKECIATWNQDLQFRPRFSPTVYKYSCLMSNAGLPGLVPTPNIDDLSSCFNGIGNVINLALDNRNKDLGTIILKLEWYKLTLQWTDFTHIYTDGSKSGMGTGCAFVVPSAGTSCGFKLPDKLTVFSAEMIAIYQTLLYIKSNGIVGSFLICSDSLSVLNYLAMKQNDAKETAAQIEKIVDDLLKHGYDLQLTWVPAHAGIPGNESADKMAKWACRNGELLDANLSLSGYIQSYEAI
ncbi:hypothetical protein QYM36_000726 [Artemia franciscana]|uniref:RNase H type-1 domain-containing protein n=1 Tax=Artemia franciscana TaxID=6661 RepID=A0AA88LDG8_ARTSF|nr:hypothetical protein QYM36_000726 [Artemia franciscana]